MNPKIEAAMEVAPRYWTFTEAVVEAIKDSKIESAIIESEGYYYVYPIGIAFTMNIEYGYQGFYRTHQDDGYVWKLM